jgi:hypothetical protein
MTGGSLDIVRPKNKLSIEERMTPFAVAFLDCVVGASGR